MNTATLPEFCTILTCNDLDASERFYNQLGFTRSGEQWPAPGKSNTYRMLSNGKGGYLRLTDAVERWLVPGKNPFGLYLYLEDVDAIARRFQKSPKDEPWGMYEFALSDPDETLVRVGWPSRLRRPLTTVLESAAKHGAECPLAST